MKRNALEIGNSYECNNKIIATTLKSYHDTTIYNFALQTRNTASQVDDIACNWSHCITLMQTIVLHFSSASLFLIW
jgi:hypothetical protein